MNNNNNVNKLLSNAKNMTANLEKKSPLIKMLVIITIVICVLFIIASIFYIFTDCYNKKSFGDFLLSLTVCDEKYKPASYNERKNEHEKEVFQISDQVYTYEEAQCKAEAYGATLATYAQLMRAYNKGAVLDNYGWSHGGDAYLIRSKCHKKHNKHYSDVNQPNNFPFLTPDEPGPYGYDEKDTIEGGKGEENSHKRHKRYGVIGGKFKHNMRFGVNLYGIKPKGEVVQQKDPVCKNKTQCSHRAKKVLNSDNISQFNPNRWSMYN